MVSFFVKNINVVGMVSLCLFAEITGCEAGVFFWWQYLWLSRYLAGCGLYFVAPWCIPRPHDFVFRNVASIGVFM